MAELVTKPDHGSFIGKLIKNEQTQSSVIATETFQNFLDDLEVKLNESLFGTSVKLIPYTVATLPEVPDAATPGLIFVSDESGGAVPAFSDGTDWRRVTDRAVIS